MPAVVAIWYPAAIGIPWFPVLTALPVVAMILRPRIKVPAGLGRPLAALVAFALLGGAAFLLQTATGGHVNRRMEIYLFAVNLLFGPLLFYLVALQPATARVRLLNIASVATVFIVLTAIVGQVGPDITAFDKQGRLSLPLVPNSIAPTSVSLVLGLLFVGQLSVERPRRAGMVRLTLLLALGALIYLLATRFVFLIVVGSIGWILLRNLKRGAVLRLAGGLAVLGLAYGYVASAGGQANERFLSEVRSFELATSPLDDTSLAIRVIQWGEAVQDIRSQPLGYGYMTFVDKNVYSDPVLGARGFNTHNEFLLQILALGWLPPLVLLAFLLEVGRIHARHGTLANFVPVLLGLGISAVFETFSNNPNSVNTVGLAYLVLAVTLPRSEQIPSHEEVLAVEGTEGEVGEDRLLDEAGRQVRGGA